MAESQWAFPVWYVLIGVAVLVLAGGALAFYWFLGRRDDD
jgi:hypothetical protein